MIVESSILYILELRRSRNIVKLFILVESEYSASSGLLV